MQTLNSISAEKNSTVIFPLPMDLISRMLKGGSVEEEKVWEEEKVVEEEAEKEDTIDTNKEEELEVFPACNEDDNDV